jgi:hypothetical protein
MEDGIKTTTPTQSVQSESQGGKVLAGSVFEERREMEPVWNPEKFGRELRVLAWTISLGPEHRDFGFFRNGECKKCSGCSDEFHFLHYTSEKKKNAYCVKCYLEQFCEVIEDDTIFLVIIKKSQRILIEIQKS